MTVPSTLGRTAKVARAWLTPLGSAVRLNIVAAVQTRRQGHRAWAGAEITDYDPLDPTTAAAPHEAYRVLHGGGRVHYNPKRATWVIGRHEDVRAALRAATVMSSADGVTRIRTSVPNLLVTSDGENHARMRRQVLPAFTRKALESWRPTIDKLAGELVADVIADPGCDVVDRLAIPLPVRLIASLLGVPDSDMNDFRRWSEASVRFLDLAPTPRGMASIASASAATLSLWRYFRHQFALGNLKGSDTVLGRLLTQSEEDEMSDVDLFFFAVLLLIAGNETTTNLIGGMFDSLARNPEQYDLIRADPDLIPMAVEEQLRLTSPIQNLYRTPREDYPIGRAVIPAGSRVLLSFGAANRDPLVFDHPDEYRVERNPKEHLAFGFGPHLCLGAQLARLEAQAVLRELVANVSRISAVGDTTWSTNSSLWGPTRLAVRLTPT